jgi:ketosteroid isomerase-like protein
MKITLVAITALFVAIVPFAVAQEESPSPAASPEATASDPSVSVTTEKTSPPPKSETSPSPTKSSSPTATKSSPSAAPSTSSSPAAAMPTKKSTPEATIREIEDKWEASVMTHDPSVAQAYLADDFRGVSSKGKVMSKSNLLSEIKKDTDTYESTKNGKVDVRVFGGQFAVATGTSTEIGKAKDGQAFKRTFRWTDVWVVRKDKWQCVASQAMLVK